MTEERKEELIFITKREQWLIAYSILKREQMIVNIKKEITDARRTMIAKPEYKDGIEAQIKQHEQMVDQIKFEIQNKKDSIAEFHVMLDDDFLAEIEKLINPTSDVKVN